MQQAPKLGESLELPLGPPVSVVVFSLIKYFGTTLHSRHFVAAALRAARCVVKCCGSAVLCFVVWSGALCGVGK